MITDILFLIIIGGVIGAVSGYLGSFMVIKRMSLVGDALSHVALPGIAIASMFGVNPMLGAFTALGFATVAIWYLSEKSEIYPEALVGIFFTASLAIGILITPELEIFEALFGDIDKVTRADGLAILAGSVLILVVTKMISKKLTLDIVSSDLSKTTYKNISLINLLYMLMVGLVITLGIKFLGTLLTGALVIIPAVTAKNLAGNLKSYQVISIICGVVSATIGVVVAKNFSLPSGPAIVLSAIAICIISFLVRNKFSFK